MCVRVVISENEPFLPYCYDYLSIYEARFFSLNTALHTGQPALLKRNSMNFFSTTVHI
jgi:hypothetical protein